MRISDRMMQMTTMLGIRLNQARVAEAQRQATSGRRVERASDDPVAAARAMRMQGQIANIEQFERNSVSATTRLATEETVLKAARELMARARKAAMGVTSDDPNDPTRKAAFQELQFIREQMVSLANTRVGDERLFGGGSTAAPFQADGTYTGGTQVHDVLVDEGVTLPTSHTGQVFASTFSSLNAMESALAAGPVSIVAATVQQVAAADQDLLGVQTEAGARQRHVDDTVKQLAGRQQLLLDRTQELLDADPAESILKLTSASQSLERAYAVSQRTMSLNIVNWMR
ncbi:MAG: flagellar hook-associated protein FlgL [Candidatus Eisenbacteria bacterium]